MLAVARYDIVSAMKLVLSISFAVTLWAQQIGLPADQQAAKKTIPPPGIAVPDADQRALRAILSRLDARLDALKATRACRIFGSSPKPSLTLLTATNSLPPEEIFQAKELLRIATERTDQLSHGDAPGHAPPAWSSAATFRKSMAACSLMAWWCRRLITPDEPHPWRVDAWFHGRSETLSEINFLWDRIQNPGEFQPRDTIVLHLYGRYCNASTFAGEVDLVRSARRRQEKLSRG